MTAAILPPERPDELRAFVERLTDNGWPLAPIVAGEKGCRDKAWSRRAFGPDEFVRRLLKIGHAPSIALRLRGLVMIDIDADDEATARRLRKLAEATIGDTPLVRFGRAPRLAMFFRTPAFCAGMLGAEKRLTWQQTGIPVEIRAGRDRLGAAYGRHPDTRRGYAWESENPLDMPVDAVPEATERGLLAFREAVVRLFEIEKRGAPEPIQAAPENTSKPASVGAATDGRRALLRNAVCSAVAGAKARGGILDGAAIEREAWEAFSAKADLRHRKGNGRGFWSIADVRREVAYTLKPGRVARIAPMRSSRIWSSAARQALAIAIRRDARCSQTTAEVAAVMLSALNVERDGREVCSMSSESIAAHIAASSKSVRVARRKLIAFGYFIEIERGYRRSASGRKGKATVVHPNPAWLESASFAESSADAGGVVVPFPEPSTRSLANKSQVTVRADETVERVPSKGTEPFYDLISPSPLDLPTLSDPAPDQASIPDSPSAAAPPAARVQGDLFGGETPIGGDLSAFGGWFRGERLRLGLSQAAIGALIGLKQPHVANIERGHDGLSPERRRLLLEILARKGAAA